MRSACFFWPGSEARIAGFQPTYYLKFDDKIDDTARIQQVLAWLRLPAADRPHFITLYYSEPDHEGHEFGPDAPETKTAVLKVDGLIGKLKAGLDATGLPIDLVVVSDHGMAKVKGGWITLDQFADLTGFDTVGTLLYGKTEEDRVRVYNQLKKASPQFVVYRRKDVPAALNYNQNPRGGHCHGTLRHPRAWAAGRQAGSAADSWSAWIRSGTVAGDESQLLCGGAGYCARKDGGAV
jgi:alkaline phosphatase D